MNYLESFRIFTSRESCLNQSFRIARKGCPEQSRAEHAHTHTYTRAVRARAHTHTHTHTHTWERERERERERQRDRERQRERNLKGCLEQTSEPRAIYRELSKEPSWAEHRPLAWAHLFSLLPDTLSLRTCLQGWSLALWEMNSLEELKQFPLSSSASPAQYSNTEDHFLSLWNESWACVNLKCFSSGTFLFASVIFHLFGADSVIRTHG
jgi:hypothetical protein